tara:strand:- start:2459 stop:2845 length:387 start_codon:yes stop_codon:yes gene_type:complete
MPDKRPDELPVITSMADKDILIVQTNTDSDNILERKVSKITKENLGFVSTDTQEFIRLDIPSGASDQNLTFTNSYDSIPHIVGSLRLPDDSQNIYTINFVNASPSGVKAIYSSTVNETGNILEVFIRQ